MLELGGPALWVSLGPRNMGIRPWIEITTNKCTKMCLSISDSQPSVPINNVLKKQCVYGLLIT